MTPYLTEFGSNFLNLSVKADISTNDIKNRQKSIVKTPFVAVAPAIGKNVAPQTKATKMSAISARNSFVFSLFIIFLLVLVLFGKILMRYLSASQILLAHKVPFSRVATVANEVKLSI